jgi:hypothetical protein
MPEKVPVLETGDTGYQFIRNYGFFPGGEHPLFVTVEVYPEHPSFPALDYQTVVIRKGAGRQWN